MFKRLFRSGDDDGNEIRSSSEAANLAAAVSEASTMSTVHGQVNGQGQLNGSGAVHRRPTACFEQIYQNASARPSRLPYDILKVSEMLTSQHLAGMSTETKRASLLMALEAAGVVIEDLLQDAVARQRALNDYEESQRAHLKDFENAKIEENRQIQAEIDKITNQYVTRIQSNLDEVARAQDDLRNWQKQKQEEAQRITEAATYCVPPGAAASNGTMAAMLERATVGRR